MRVRRIDDDRARKFFWLYKAIADEDSWFDFFYANYVYQGYCMIRQFWRALVDIERF